MSADEVRARLEGVVKDYPRRDGGGHLRALAGVDMEVHAGEAVGLLGPNRAGKTTAAKALLGLTRPDAGRAERFGRPASDRVTLARVGFVPDAPVFPPHRSARATLRLLGSLSGLGGRDLALRTEQTLERVGLDDRRREPVGRFSRGMIQRLALAQAILHGPDLLILDEPSFGLDLAGRELLGELIRERREAGAAVLLITHSTGVAGLLCDRIVVLVAGTVVHDGPTSALRGGDGRLPLDTSLSRLYGMTPGGAA
jgi:ABC-2 type transport system ATP-binding protein